MDFPLVGDVHSRHFVAGLASIADIIPVGILASLEELFGHSFHASNRASNLQMVAFGTSGWEFRNWARSNLA
jgi:hypothetical protein